MIFYATDSNSRTTTYGFLMVVAVAIQFSILPYVQKLNGLIGSNEELNSLIGTNLASPTAFFLFWVLFLLYERVVWKIRIIIPFSTIPDFSGDWIGYIERREQFVDKGNGEFVRQQERMIAVQMYIGQTYRKISLRLRSMSTDHSVKGQESEATSVGIFSQDFDRPKLKYTWTRQELCGEGELLLKRDHDRLVVEGNYSSNHPRIGFMRLIKVRANENWLCGKLAIIQNRDRQSYLGIHVPEDYMMRYLRVLRRRLSPNDYLAYTQNQSARDDGGFHLTILEPSECAEVELNILDSIGKSKLWVQFVGVGYQQRGRDEVFYCVATSDGAQQLRNDLGLGNRDLHVTLGFNARDIHGVPKGVDTLIAVERRVVTRLRSVLASFAGNPKQKGGRN